MTDVYPKSIFSDLIIHLSADVIMQDAILLSHQTSYVCWNQCILDKTLLFIYYIILIVTGNMKLE